MRADPRFGVFVSCGTHDPRMRADPTTPCRKFPSFWRICIMWHARYTLACRPHYAVPIVSPFSAYVHHVACVSFPCVQGAAGGGCGAGRRRPVCPKGARYNARCARAPGAEQRPDSIFDYQFKILKASRCADSKVAFCVRLPPQKPFESLRKRIRNLRLGPESERTAWSF